MLLQQLPRLSIGSLSSWARCFEVLRHFSSESSPGHLAGGIQLTEEQLGMQALAHDFAREQLMPHSAKWDEEKIFPVKVMKEAAKLGFAGAPLWEPASTDASASTGVYIPEEYGGSGLGRLDGALIFEGLSYGDVSTAAYLTIHNMVAYVVHKFGNTAIKEKYLPSLASLDKFASYCLTEPGSGSDAASLTTHAVPVEGGWLLSGSKAFISGAGSSDVYLVMARCQGQPPSKQEAGLASGPLAASGAGVGAENEAAAAATTSTSASKDGAITAFLVEKSMAGVSFGAPERKMGWRSQPTGTVNLDKVFVPHENMLGQQGSGFKIAMHALDGGRINIGACSVGGAAFCLDYAWRYAAERQQFGQPVGSFQATQFKLADMATGLEASRAMVRGAAVALDAQSPRATLAAAMAKRFATDTCFHVANDALQLLGGYGYLQDHPVERYCRDLRVHSILEGTNEIMRVIIHRQLQRLDYHHLL